MAALKDVVVAQGHTYITVLRWEVPPIIYKPITHITAPNGAARIEATGHGMLDGWRGAVTNCKGMTEINAMANRLRDDDYHAVTVVDANTIEFNDVNASGFNPHTQNTGFLQYNTPASLAGFTGRIRMKTRKGGTILASNLVADAPNNVIELVIDTVKHTIVLTFPPAASILLAGKVGWYDVEMVSPDVVPVVTSLVSGKITVEKE